MKQLAVAVVLVASAIPVRAEADCGTQRWFGAAPETRLPVYGSIYVHDEAMVWDEGDEVPAPAISWAGLGAVVAIEKVGRVVYRIDYAAPYTFGATAYPDDSWSSTHVVFDPRWRAPTRAPRVLQYWHDTYAWTCSSSDSVKIQLDQPVAAVSVRWTFNGVTREFIEAPRANEAGQTTIEVGKINCGSTTIDPAELATGGRLELIAIRADRTEIAVTGLPRFLSTKKMPSGDDRTMHLQSPVPDEPAIAETPTPENDAPSKTLGIFVLGMFGLGGLLAFRFRVRAPDYLR